MPVDRKFVIYTAAALALIVAIGCSSEPRLAGLPDGFPRDVYVYENSQVEKVIMAKGKALGSDGQPLAGMPVMPSKAFMVSFMSSDDPTAVLEQFKLGMTEEGWKAIDVSADPAGDLKAKLMEAMGTVNFQKGDNRVVQITVNSTVSGTHIMIQCI